MPKKIIPSYEEAQKIVQGRVKNRDEYFAFRLKYPEYNLPNSPRASYRKEYETMHEFLGVPKYDQKKCLEQYWIDVKAGKRTRKYGYDNKVPITNPVPSYEEARKILKGREVLKIREYLKFREENPKYNLPRHPNLKYKDQWVSYPNFLRNI
jgi:hypothetical protein